jgi:hypothetical protein
MTSHGAQLEPAARLLFVEGTGCTDNVSGKQGSRDVQEVQQDEPPRYKLQFIPPAEEEERGGELFVEGAVELSSVEQLRHGEAVR